jgi:hypothetical protein
MPRHYIKFGLASPKPADEFRRRPGATVTDIVERHGGTLLGLAFDPDDNVGYALVDAPEATKAMLDDLDAVEHRPLLSPEEWRKKHVQGKP